MATRKQHYVVFSSPGTLFSESSRVPVDSWDLKNAVGKAETILERHGAKPYGFHFETMLEHDPISDDMGGTLKVEAKRLETSPSYHLGGTVRSLDEVIARNDPEEEILRSNMCGNGYWYIIVNTNSWKSTRPFEKDDVVVNAFGQVIERGDDPTKMAYRARKEAERDAEAEAWRKSKNP